MKVHGRSLAILLAMTLPSPLAAAGHDWQTYENDEYGFSLQYPRTMAVYTDEQAASPAFFFAPRPDVTIVFPVPYDESHVSLAAVVIDYEPEDCAPIGEPDGNIELAGKRFQRSLSIASEGGHTNWVESFQVLDRGRCFSITAVIHSYHRDEQASKRVRRSRWNLESIKERLLGVIHTLEFANRPDDWKRYDNQVLGIRLLHPPSMMILPGTDPVYAWPPSDVRLAIPVESLAGTSIRYAFASLYGGPMDDCAYDKEGDIRTLGGRPFRHYRDARAVSDGTLSTEYWSKVYGGRCLTISIAITTRRFVRSEGEPKSFRRLSEVERELQQIVKSVRFTDPAVGTYP